MSRLFVSTKMTIAFWENNIKTELFSHDSPPEKKFGVEDEKY